MTIGEYNLKGFGLEFALYLEGIRVPFVGATVSSSPNNPSTCVVELPPFPSAAQVRPRTLVHLFYYDTPFKNTGVNESSDIAEVQQEEWKLLFEGEVSHTRVIQNASSRNISLVCQDFTNYWNHCYQYFINNAHGQTGSSTEVAIFTNGVDSSGPIAEIQTIYNIDFQGATGDIVLNSILKPNRNTVPLGLLDLITKIGGEASNNSITGINKFFSAAEQRIMMARRTFMVPDANIANFVKQQAGSALSYIQQFTGSLSGLGTVNDVVRKFLGQCFYDYVSFSAPPFGFNQSRDVTLPNGAINQDPVSFPGNLPSPPVPTVLTTILKPKTFFLPAPRCNIFYPSRYTRFSYSQSHLDEPSRLRLKIAQGLPGEGVPFFQSGFQETVVYAPPAATTFFTKEVNETQTLAQKLSLGQPVSVADYQAVIRDYGIDPSNTTNYNLVFDAVRGITEPESGIIPVFDTLDQTQGLVIGELSETGLAPSASVQDKLGTLVSWGQNGTTYQLADTATNQNARNRLRYYLAAADYQLDVRKFEQRSVTDIEGGFNPNLLVGFPAALLTSMGIFLGELASVTHRISQGGATTICQMTHARQFPVPSFLSSASPDMLQALVGFDPSSGFPDPVTGDAINAIYNPITGAQVNITDRSKDDFPVFINDLYKPDNVSLNIYEPIFNTKSIFERVNDSGESFSNGGFGSAGGINKDQYSAALTQYIDYLSATDKVGYVNYSTFRNVTAIQNIRGMYGSGAIFNPVFQDDWYTLTNDEYLFGSAGTKPFFSALNSPSTFTKQLIVQNITRDMRVSLGREPGTSMIIDSQPILGNGQVNGRPHRAGAVVGA